MFQTKVVQKIKKKTHLHTTDFFFSNSFSLWDNVENIM